MNWERIGSYKFEQISLLYAKSIDKNCNWKPTKRSWDGNRDGECIINLGAINTLLKGWYESKYTINTNKSIPHTHMDSTLVSAVLDGNVKYLLFITNGKIANEFKRRASSLLSPYKVTLSFVEGEHLETWLNKNSDIYHKFFCEDLENNELVIPELNVDDICFLDRIMDLSIITKPLTHLLVGNEYNMYLGINSNIQGDFTIKFNTSCLIPIPHRGQKNCTVAIQSGYNPIYLRCEAKDEFEGTLQIIIEDKYNNSIYCSNYDCLKIRNEHLPVLSYAQQTMVSDEIVDFLKAENTQNTILSVEGREGCGKSYMIKRLLESLLNFNNDCISLQFSEKNGENASALCKLILFLNFGNLYTLSKDAFLQLVESNALPLDMFIKLLDGVNNQAAALHAIKLFCKLCENEDYAIIPFHNFFLHTSTSYIIIDDIQKLNKEYSALFQSLLKEFCKRNFSQIIIMSYRPQEFKYNSLEYTIKKISAKIWKLQHPSIVDVKETLTREINGFIGVLAELYPQNFTALSLIMLIKHLKAIRIDLLDEISASNAYIESCKTINFQYNSYALRQIENALYPKNLYLIYKIETGVSLAFLDRYWGKSANTIINYFKQENLVKEKDNKIVPFHDAYLYAFEKSKINNPDYLSEFVKILSHFNNIDSFDDALKSKIISILLTEGDFSISGLKTSAMELCKSLYNNSEFYSAKILAKAILPDIHNVNPYLFDSAMLEILYILAQTVKFTEGHENSNKIFKILVDLISLNNVEPTSIDMGLDSISEVLNNEMWLLNFSEVDKCMRKLEKLNFTNCNTTYKENAYLNYLNRKMMYHSFTLPDVCEKDFEIALTESARLNRADYIAYAKMDRARILYTINPSKSIELLKDAEVTLQQHPKYLRRLLNCRSELTFLETILFNNSYDRLYNIQKDMLRNGFINSYATITLKIITCELLSGAITSDMATKKLHQLILAVPEFKTNKRIVAIICQLQTLIAFKEKNYKQMEKYTKTQIKNLSRLHENYQVIPKNNLLIKDFNANIVWSISPTYTENTLLLDPRMW